MRGKVEIEKSDLLEVVKHLEMIVVSLDRIGSATANSSREEQARVLCQFHDGWDVSQKLAECRKILSALYSDELGEDDMDELERALQEVKFWSPED